MGNYQFPISNLFLNHPPLLRSAFDGFRSGFTLSGISWHILLLRLFRDPSVSAIEDFCRTRKVDSDMMNVVIAHVDRLRRFCSRAAIFFANSWGSGVSKNLWWLIISRGLGIGLGGVAGSAGRNIQAMLARGGIC